MGDVGEIGLGAEGRVGGITVFAFSVFLRKPVTLPVSVARNTWGAFGPCQRCRLTGQDPVSPSHRVFLPLNLLWPDQSHLKQ